MKLYVTGNALRLMQNDPQTTSGSVNFSQAFFVFEEDWAGLAKTAVWRTPLDVCHVLIGQDGRCAVPAQILQHPVELSVAVMGVAQDSGEDVGAVITTNYISLGKIAEGADRTSDPALEPEPTIYERLLSQIHGAIPMTQKGAAEGVAPLDAQRRVPKEHLPSFLEMGGVPILYSYTKEGGADGVDYMVDLPEGSPPLKSGDKITIMPHIENAYGATMSVKGLFDSLDVYATSATNNGPYDYIPNNYICPGIPITLTFMDFDGWACFSAENIKIVDLSDVYGTLGVNHGGTGKASFTKGSYIIGNGTANFTELKPAAVCANIGAANTELTNVLPLTIKNRLEEAGIDFGTEPFQEYDQVIRTQAEFEALIASPTWLDAVSVCFVGDGGNLKFTRSDGQGCKIPQTVKQIQGINSATIEVTNFAYKRSSNRAALWYEIQPETHDYWINGLSVHCNGGVAGAGYANCACLTNCVGSGSGGTDGSGFVKCTQLTNCAGAGKGEIYGNGFTSCTKLVNCEGGGTATGASTCYGCGFNQCTQLINCIGTGTDGDLCYGFDHCTQAINCTGISTARSYAYGFDFCTELTNCMGSGIGGKEGYTFSSCKYLNGCKQDTTPSSTAFLGGTNTHVDEATVAES